MRIISGKSRGTRLASVGKGDAAAHLRPTSDRVRESIFNLLMGGAYGDPITDARVLDLFAGTGALGLEALSRGAAHATFVDDGRKALSLIRQNIDLTRCDEFTRVMSQNATRLRACKTEPFDLVFLDPPYGKALGEKALAVAASSAWLRPGALVVWEENAAQSAPDGFVLLDQRRYGDTSVSIMRLGGLQDVN